MSPIQSTQLFSKNNECNRRQNMADTQSTSTIPLELVLTRRTTETIRMFGQLAYSVHSQHNRIVNLESLVQGLIHQNSQLLHHINTTSSVSGRMIRETREMLSHQRYHPYAPPTIKVPSPCIDPVPAAFLSYRQSALTGQAVAQFNLACCYRDGLGTSKNQKFAFEWFKAAAEQGHTGAQYHLACCFNYSRGTNQDLKLAFDWCKKAAEQGHAGAQFNLALCYKEGKGTNQDLKLAFESCKEAAEQGHANAQNDLACCYNYGIGTEPNTKLAFESFKKAAKQGHAKAQVNLAICYKHGRGTDQDLKLAIEWYDKAAKQGHTESKKQSELLNKVIETPYLCK